MPINGNELSEREQEILRLVATGASNKEIAQRLFISTNTVKVHLRNIFGKIGVASRTEAAMYAVNARLASGSAPVQNIGVATPPEKQYVLSNGMVFRSKSSRKVLAIVLGSFAVLGAMIFGLAAYSYKNLVSATPTPEIYPLIESPRWTKLAPMPTARYSLATVTVNGLIFAIGGKTANEVTDLVESYDPVTNLWKSVLAKPTPVYEVNAVVVGGKVYVPGGRLSSGAMTDVLEIYDPRGNTWIQGARLPVALSAYALSAYEGKIYLFGGWNGTDYLASVYEYDPALNAWSVKMPMHTPRAYLGAAVAGGKIFVIGGYDGKEALSTNEVFQPDIADDQEYPWSKAQPLPEGLYAIGANSLADIIYIVGGNGNVDRKYPALAYFYETLEWGYVETSVVDPGSYLGLTNIGTKLYLLGGELAGEPSQNNLAYNAIYAISFPIIIK